MTRAAARRAKRASASRRYWRLCAPQEIPHRARRAKVWFVRNADIDYDMIRVILSVIPYRPLRPAHITVIPALMHANVIAPNLPWVAIFPFANWAFIHRPLVRIDKSVLFRQQCHHEYLASRMICAGGFFAQAHKARTIAAALSAQSQTHSSWLPLPAASGTRTAHLQSFSGFRENDWADSSIGH